MPPSSLPDGAVRVAAPTRRCAVCASANCNQADYGMKYEYARGVFHANCYAQLSLFGLPYEKGSERLHALLGSVADARPRSAEVQSPQRVVGSEGEQESFCDARLAVWLG